MSNFGIEKLLWQAFQNPADAGAFREDAEAFLAGFRVRAADESIAGPTTTW